MHFGLGHSDHLAVQGLPYFTPEKGVFIALLAPSLVFRQ